MKNIGTWCWTPLRKRRKLTDLFADKCFFLRGELATGAEGYVYKLGLMPGGEVIVSGYFRKFAGVSRNNFVVLEANGAVHKTYNTNGGVTLSGNAALGGINGIIPMTGQPSMLMVGTFSQYDYRQANRIVKIKYQ